MRGQRRHSSTAPKVSQFSLETVAGETLKPQRISETSWILLTATPASYISIIASSRKLSCLR
nr:hypothetical protein [Atopobium sp. oral taxon 416]